MQKIFDKFKWEHFEGLGKSLSLDWGVRDRCIFIIAH